METTANKTTDTKHKTVVIKRIFNLPITKVWAALTEEEELKKWWGPNDYTCPYYDIDLEPDGNYLACMKEKKSGKETWSTGIFIDIVPNKKLSMTDNFSDNKGNIIPAPKEMPGDWSKNLIITYEVEEHNGKTNFTLTHEGQPAEVYDDCIRGWNECFDKLEKNIK